MLVSFTNLRYYKSVDAALDDLEAALEKIIEEIG